MPDTWAALLLLGHSYWRRKIDVGDKIRWRILFGEAIWTHWKLRCNWLFSEVDNITPIQAVNLFHGRIRGWYQRDRLRAVKIADGIGPPFLLHVE